VGGISPRRVTLSFFGFLFPQGGGGDEIFRGGWERTLKDFGAEGIFIRRPKRGEKEKKRMAHWLAEGYFITRKDLCIGGKSELRGQGKKGKEGLNSHASEGGTDSV